MNWRALRLSDPAVELSLQSRATRAFLTLVVALVLLTPLQHLHSPVRTAADQTIGTFTASSAACSVCTYRSNLALPGATVSLQEPHGESPAHEAVQPAFGFDDPQPASSRAPPITS